MPYYTFAEQWKLYQKYLGGKNSVAAIPGTKHHGTFDSLVSALEPEHTTEKNYGKGLTGVNPLYTVGEIETVNPQTKFWDSMSAGQIIADIQKYKKLIQDQYVQPKYVEPEPEPWHFEYEGIWVDEVAHWKPDYLVKEDGSVEDLHEPEKSEAPISAEEYLKRMMQ